jgi:2-hydroxycyclohexanecarboxyl-CoA dehydrogenase
MDTGLGGKAVIVTGATTNIGRGIARSFAMEGAKVAICGRDAEAGAVVVAEALAAGAADAVFLAADLLEPTAAAGMVAEAEARFGGIDVLVNNLGGSAAITEFADSTEEQWRYDLDINVMTMLRTTRAVLPGMIARRRGGRIINIASTAGLVGDVYLASYSAAKAAMYGFTVTLAMETGRHEITVNAVAPYATLPANPAEQASRGSRFNPVTGMFANPSADTLAMAGQISRKTVLPRSAAFTDEIGGAAVYLASRQAAFVTGETIVVDGGIRLGWRHPETPAG